MSDSDLPATNPKEKPHQPNNFLWLMIILLLTLLSGSVAVFQRYYGPDAQGSLVDTKPISPKNINPIETTWEQFDSEAAFQEFMNRSQSYGSRSFGLDRVVMPEMMQQESLEGDQNDTTADRVSTTNVQVFGIDEPDIVKTNGKEIFVSGRLSSVRPIPLPVPEPRLLDDVSSRRLIAPENYSTPTTDIIQAYPPTELETIGSLDTSGDLLIHNQTLIVLNNESIRAFDISDPTASEQENWQYSLNESFLKTARLYDDQLVLVLQKYAYDSYPCPLPIMTGLERITVRCTDIWFPPQGSGANTTYTIVSLNPETGAITQTTTLVGQDQYSVVHASSESLYLTYTTQVQEFDYMIDFLTSEGRGLLDSRLVSQLSRLENLDISDQAKQTEYQVLLNSFYQTLTNDERVRLQNELQNQLAQYLSSRGRELETTSIVKMPINSLNSQTVGQVPGHPLNQFSLDEYQQHLRIATTVGGRNLSGNVSENDVYILDKDLERQGQVQGLGLDERIYAVRFIGAIGYVVTFREIDPFYVLDLSQPNSPKMTGELKIPGFSSYLHPLTNNQILGIGRQDGRVKLSIFNVANPFTPIEEDTYYMDEYWTEAESNHHAFLHDDQFGSFFLPGRQAGYIFSYTNGLELVRTVTDIQAQRALYLDDYLYVVGQNGLVVLDQTNWTEINRITFQ